MRHPTLLFTCLALFLSSSWTEAQELQRRQAAGLAALMSGSGGQGQEKSQATGPPQDPSAPVNDSCKALPFTQETWQKLNLDDYLRTYPGGANLSVKVSSDPEA